MMYRTAGNPREGVEALEARRLFAGSAKLAEVESNNSTSTAMPIDLKKNPFATLSGFADSPADRDYFRVKVSANSRLQISIQNLSGSSVKFRVTDAFLTPLVSGNKKASLYLDGGRNYFVKLQSNSDSSARYRIDFSAYTTEVSPKRLDLLRKGVNLPEWFWNISGDVRTAMQRSIGEEDVTLIKQLGFGHIRLPVEMKYFFDDTNHFTLNPTYLDELDAAISMLESHGLGVVICPFGDHQNWLEYGGDARADAMAFSWTLARFLSRFDPDFTFIQTTNEPLGGGADWQSLQSQLVQSIRAAAPKNTIITATPLYYGPNESTFGTTGALTELATYRDTNVVYGLHFYEPFVFTHQGAAWAIPGMEYISGLSYPSNLSQTAAMSDALRPQFTGTRNEPVVDLVKYYGIEQWNRAKIAGRLNQAATWAAKNRVPMILDEFGVYGLNVDDASRYNYLSDVRTVAESAGMGWTVWDYDSEFGVVSHPSGSKPTLRYDVLAALNLTAPSP